MVIRDKLEEKCFLEEPIISIVEWIPFGPHQFEHLISAITTSWSPIMERPSFLTDKREEEPKECVVSLEPDMARIALEKLKRREIVSFKADVYYQEEEGIRQIEQMGVSVFSCGLVVYSTKVKKVYYDEASSSSLRDYDLVSLDRASRIICDLMEDTSRLMSTLLTPYQRRMLDIIYPRSEEELYERKKIIFVFTRDLMLRARGKSISVWDSEGFEKLMNEHHDIRMEIQQLIGDIQDVHIVEEDAVGKIIIVRGLDGFLFITKDVTALLKDELKKKIKLIMLFTSLNVFFRHLMARTWMIWDQLMQERKRCFARERALDRARGGDERTDALKMREALSEMLSNVVLLEDACVTIRLSINRLKDTVRQVGGDEDRVLGLMEPISELEELDEKVEQAENTLHALRTDIEGLIDILTTLAEEEMKRVRESMDKNIRTQVEMMVIEQIENESLRLIEIFSGGLLAAELAALFLTIYEGLTGRIEEWLRASMIITTVILFSVLFFVYMKYRIRRFNQTDENKGLSTPCKRTSYYLRPNEGHFERS